MGVGCWNSKFKIKESFGTPFFVGAGKVIDYPICIIHFK